MKQIANSMNDVEVTVGIGASTYILKGCNAITKTFGRTNSLLKAPTDEDSDGIAFSDNTTNPDTASIEVFYCSIALYNKLVAIYLQSGADRERINVTIKRKGTKDYISFPNAVIQERPHQTSVTEGSGSLSFTLAVASPRAKENVEADPEEEYKDLK